MLALASLGTLPSCGCQCNTLPYSFWNKDTPFLYDYPCMRHQYFN